MHQTSASRSLRSVLLVAPLRALAFVFGLALVLGCDQARFGGEASPVASDIAFDAPLSAEFALANGSIVSLDYSDSQNFRLTDNASATETLVVDGEIYLRFPEQDSMPERLWRYGELAPEQSRRRPASKFALRPTLIPPQGVALWGEVGEVFDVEVHASGPLGTPTDATVAKMPKLANAQWRIATRLLPAMDMALCGNGVQQLTSWWDPDLAGQGWAILATSAGIRLDGSVTALAEIPTLPAGIEPRALPTENN